MIILKYNLQVHVSVLHARVCSESPTQLFPPSKGGGLLHSLIRFLYPIPHDFVQPEYELHGPQRPLVTGEVFIRIYNFSSHFSNLSD